MRQDRFAIRPPRRSGAAFVPRPWLRRRTARIRLRIRKTNERAIRRALLRAGSRTLATMPVSFRDSRRKSQTSFRSCGRSQDAADDLDEGMKLPAPSGEGFGSRFREMIDAPPGAAPALGFLFPFRFDQPRIFKAIEGRIKRSFLEFKRATAGLLESAQDFQAMRVAAIEDGEDHRFQMAAQLVARYFWHWNVLNRHAASPILVGNATFCRR